MNDEEVEFAQLAKWIKIRMGGLSHTVIEVTEAYLGLMRFIGQDPDHPKVGLDLVEDTLREIHKRGRQIGATKNEVRDTGIRKREAGRKATHAVSPRR